MLPRPGRRALLGGLAAAVLAGCGTAAGPSASPGSTDSSAGGSTSGSGDDRVAAEGLALAAGLASLVGEALRVHPGLRGELRRLRLTHRVHVAALADSDAADTAAEPPTVPDVPDAARRQVLRRERAAVTSYADLAARAEGGRLARLLAAAAAGIAQRLEEVDAGGGGAVLGEPGGLDAAGLPGAELSGVIREALQTTLGAEHAAIWTLAAVGARAFAANSGDVVVEIDAGYEQHLARRDALTGALRAAGAEPVAAAPAYETPDLGQGLAGRQAAARGVEDACATTYAFLVASSTGEPRAWAGRALADAAVRRVRLGGDPEDLPGL